MKPALVIAIVLLVSVIVVVFWYRSRGVPARPDGTAASPPIQMIDPSKVLFSLATICDRLPPMKAASGKPATDDLILAEDDWRQIEFVSLADSAYIRQELTDLLRFKEENREGMGYRKIHVRTDHPHEMYSLGLTLEHLRSALPDTSKEGRVFLSSGGTPTEVEGGFAFRSSDGNTVYGYAVQGVVAALGLESTWEAPIAESTAQAVAQISHSSKVLLVDWYWAQEVDSANVAGVQKWVRDHSEQMNRFSEERAKKKH